MTCQEIQKLTSEKYPLDMTRGERAVIIQHLIGCQQCRQSLRNAPMPVVLDLNRVVATLNMCVEDTKDGEFMEVVYKDQK